MNLRIELQPSAAGSGAGAVYFDPKNMSTNQ